MRRRSTQILPWILFAFLPPAAAAPAAAPEEGQYRFVEAWRVPLGSPLAGPLLPLGSTLAAATRSGSVALLGVEDGRTVWRVELEEQTASGPVIFAGRIVQAAASGRVTALAAEDGSRVWSADLGDAVHGSGVAAGGGLVFALAGGQLASLDPQGNLLWKVRLQDAPSAPPSACGDLVFAGTQAGTLEAFTAGSGVRKWVYRAGGAVRSRVLCHRGRLYFGTADDRFHCIRPEGRRKWSFRVGGDVTATPLAEGRRVYFLCYDNYLYVLKARSGHLLTQVRLSHRLSEDALRLGDALLLSPHTSGRISMLSLPALGLVAEFPLELAGDWFTTPPAAAGDRILVGYGRTEGRVLALRLERKPAEPPGAR